MVVMILSIVLVIPRVLNLRGLVIHAGSGGDDAVHHASDPAGLNPRGLVIHAGSGGDYPVHHGGDSAGSQPAGFSDSGWRLW